MIPGPQMTPKLDRKWSQDRKWPPNWTANDPAPEMIRDGDRKWSRLKNKEWHGCGNGEGEDRELGWITITFIKTNLKYSALKKGSNFFLLLHWI